MSMAGPSAAQYMALVLAQLNVDADGSVRLHVDDWRNFLSAYQTHHRIPEDRDDVEAAKGAWMYRAHVRTEREGTP